MAPTIIPLAVVTRDGVAVPDAVTDDGGSLFIPDNDGNVILFVDNPGSVSASLTAIRTGEIGGDLMPPLVVEISAGEGEWFGPWPPAFFNDDDNEVVFSLDSELTVYGLRF